LLSLTIGAEASIARRSKSVVQWTNATKFYVNYWAQFAAFLEDRHSRFQVRRQFKDYYCTFRIGSAGVHLGAQAGRRDKLIGVELYISRADSKATYRALEAQKADIQNKFGEDYSIGKSFLIRSLLGFYFRRPLIPVTRRIVISSSSGS
jgi:Domain of unknown function (DUF4268)